MILYGRRHEYTCKSSAFMAIACKVLCLLINDLIDAIFNLCGCCHGGISSLNRLQSDI